MENTIQHNIEKKQFTISRNCETALLTYRLSPGIMNITHTKVPALMEGQGIGTALVKQALDYARENRLKVIPTCPFVRTYMVRHPETAGLLASDT